ncbi:hypothetical protein SDC9_87476 [bioreactor metagenome]|uniref:Uncharacterized protein n=1 Tax=bioreactor metagenome TaxID=1076179 RepID=A0A644ZKG9_9ZZZZ
MLAVVAQHDFNVAVDRDDPGVEIGGEADAVQIEQRRPQIDFLVAGRHPVDLIDGGAFRMKHTFAVSPIRPERQHIFELGIQRINRKFLVGVTRHLLNRGTFAHHIDHRRVGQNLAAAHRQAFAANVELQLLVFVKRHPRAAGADVAEAAEIIGRVFARGRRRHQRQRHNARPSPTPSPFHNR